MAERKTPVTDAAWAVLEDLYLESATDEQRAAYGGMTLRQKWGALEPFLLSRAKEGGRNRWISLLIERLAAKAGSGS